MTRRLATCPHCGGDLEGQADGRADWWIYRVRLYDMHVDEDNPMVDSDPGLSPEQPGASRTRGLWKVMSETAMEVAAFHNGATLRGWSADDQDRKIRGVRPTLSRNRGRATIRVEYDTIESWRDAADHVPRYLARIDLLKDGGTNDSEQ